MYLAATVSKANVISSGSADHLLVPKEGSTCATLWQVAKTDMSRYSRIRSGQNVTDARPEASSAGSYVSISWKIPRHLLRDRGSGTAVVQSRCRRQRCFCVKADVRLAACFNSVQRKDEL